MNRERGSAAVEFVAVLPLLLLVALAVLQVALFAHAKSVVDTAAVEAARVAAVSAVPQAAAREAAEEVLGEAMGGVPLTGLDVELLTVSGVPVVAVEVRAEPRFALLPVHPVVTGRGRALVEGQP